MLIQMVQTYTARLGRLVELTDAVVAYEQELAVAGYIGRRRRSVYSDSRTDRVVMMATLQHPDAPRDMLNSDIPAVTESFAAVKALISNDPITETFSTANTRDEHYCAHSRWKEIVLICDPIQGHSGLRCNECGGIIARYKLHLTHPAPKELWQWEVLYERIYDLWQVSTVYREWAENELSHVDSPITQTGLRLARQMSKELGLHVSYYLHMKQEDPSRQCPKCGQKLHEAVGTIWNLSCRDCSLAMGRG